MRSNITKEEKPQVKILLLPGMGDIYWVFVKLLPFLQANGIVNPLVYTWELQANKKNRSADYIKRFPYVEYGGCYEGTSKCATFNDLYFGTDWIKTDFEGFDYVLSFNGILRNGYSINNFGLDQYKADWLFPLTFSQEQQDHTYIYPEAYGNYIVAYFSDDGMFKQWLKYLPPQKLYEILKSLHDKTGYTIVISGCHWDKPFFDQIKACGNTDFIEELFDTSLDQLFGLMNGARGMIGWCGGNSIMSTYFKKCTLIIWSEYFKQSNFYVNSVPPQAIGEWYDYVVAEQTSVEQIVNKMMTLLEKADAMFYNNQIVNYINGGMPELTDLQDLLAGFPGSKAIDIGANIGEISWYLSKQHTIEKVYSFEPNPNVYAKLTQIINANITSECVALSDKDDQEVVLHVPRDKNTANTFNTGIGSLSTTWIDDMVKQFPEAFDADAVEQFTVTTKTLDSYRILDDVKIIKIDVEGHEQAVLDGAMKTIDSNRPLLLIEAIKYESFFPTLIAKKYICYYKHSDTNEWKTIKQASHFPSNVYNFLFVPKEHRKYIQSKLIEIKK